MADDPTLGEGYHRRSATYDRPLRLFPIEEPPLRELIEELPPGRVLDAACGTGRHATYLAARGHEVVGVDQSGDMLAIARSKLPGASFHHGSLTDLPLADRSVDAAVCALALVHVPDLGAALGELARVLRPGGRLLVSDVHPMLVLLGWQASSQPGPASVDSCGSTATSRPPTQRPLPRAACDSAPCRSRPSPPKPW